MIMITLAVTVVVLVEYAIARRRAVRAARATVAEAWWAAQEHEDWCPLAPAVVPVWAVSPSTTAAGDRPVVHHPPAECELASCDIDVWISTRENRSKRHRVFCSAEHKATDGHPAPARPKGPAFTPGRCPRPEKKAFATAEECADEFRTLLAADGSLTVYQCRCRRWHAGHPHVDDAMRIGAIAKIWGDLR